MKLSLTFTILAGTAGLLFLGPAQMPAAAQQPTGSIATVTGTPSGPMITVNYPEEIKVRAGPNSAYYPVVGTLAPGETAPAIGRSPAGEWIKISFPGAFDGSGVGWVYVALVSLSPGFLPIIEPPPTATPRTTPTIDPTLAAAFSIPTTPTRLPTFTPPPPLVIPTFTP
ncbi:MAG: SH3 domain-containing protein, partial [Anaerolineales bacterium]|nr:SH3 domain-containing protein [Anaerolineales bacterium]